MKNALFVVNKELFRETEGTETVSLRSSQIKHFALGNGCYQAITYPLPVHYNAGSPDVPEWRDIDNTLIPAKDPSGNPVYGVKSNDVRFSFPRILNASSPVVYADENGKELFLYAEDARPSEGIVNDGEQLLNEKLSRQGIPYEELSEEEKRSELPNLQSRITYPEVWEGVTLSFTVYSRQMQYALTVSDPSCLDRIAFLLPAEYTYTLTGSGCVQIRDTESHLFSILAPYVRDAEGREAGCMPVLKREEESVRLSYTVSPATLTGEETVYPIVIDPVVKTETLQTDVEDTYIWRNNPNTN